MPDTKHSVFGAIILAAGFSSRMVDFKPLMTLQGRTLLQRTVKSFRHAGLHPVVVTGHNAQEVHQEALTLGVATIHNPDYHQGMFSSVRKGVSALKNIQAFFILPVDIPLVRPATIKALMHAWQGSIIHPVFDHEPGHPPLVPATLIKDILAHDGQGGLRALLALHPSQELPVWDQGILLDADTAPDFQVLETQAAQLQIGTRAEALVLARQTMPRRGLAHGQAVAQMALSLAQKLKKYGLKLNLDLVHNAALLHDIAKGQPQHEQAGAQLLTDLGLTELSHIVASHRDLQPPASGKLTEKEIVYLGDKLMRGDQRVSIKDRFQEKLDKYAQDPQATQAIAGRLKNALAMARLFKNICGQDVHEIELIK